MYNLQFEFPTARAHTLMKWVLAGACGLYACYCVSFCGKMCIVSVQEEWCYAATWLKQKWHATWQSYQRLGNDDSIDFGADTEAPRIPLPPPQEEEEEQGGEQKKTTQLLVPLLRHRGSTTTKGRILAVFPERTRNVPMSDPPILPKDDSLGGMFSEYHPCPETDRPIEF